MRTLVLDTNVVLDLLVFGDPSAAPLLEGLEARRLRWLATSAMREELDRVLGYPAIAGRLEALGISPLEVLSQFDRHACMVDAPARAPLSCEDPDDQGFIDLAVHHASNTLLSKDRAVLSLARRLAVLQVTAAAALDAAV
jgi:predicted nucleic acid-binding protein